jgi:type II secretory pathway component PulF
MSPFFRYDARDADGMLKEGKIEALNEADAREKIQAYGLIVTLVSMLDGEEKQYSATKKCPFCAKEIAKDAIKCGSCGEMLWKKE